MTPDNQAPALQSHLPIAVAALTFRLMADGTLSVEVTADPPKSELHELASEIGLSLQREFHAQIKART